MGFWVGVFLWSINGFTELFSFDYNLINAFLLGCLSSGTSYTLNMIFGDNGVKHEVFSHTTYDFDEPGTGCADCADE